MIGSETVCKLLTLSVWMQVSHCGNVMMNQSYFIYTSDFLTSDITVSLLSVDADKCI